MGTAIVALPAVDDYVNRISSEKKAHLTLLFLGDEVSEQDLATIAQFLQHAVQTSLHRFGLSVSRRGTLGDKDADVLFFEKSWAKEVHDFRGFLLANDVINKAYQSTTQFEGWTPHLTLGYPDTPANEDDRDYPGISYVNFDRVALWTGDFDGPEFELEEKYMEADVAWSDQMDEALAHYGVKGMRWGIRKSEHEGGTNAKRAPVPSEDKARANANAAKIGKKGNTDALSNAELQQLVQRMNLEQQYSRLSSSDGRVKAGNKKAKEILETLDTGKKVWNLTPDKGKSKIKSALKKGVLKVGVGAAVTAGKIYYKTRG
jgi:2'-5' RNA ligase